MSAVLGNAVCHEQPSLRALCRGITAHFGGQRRHARPHERLIVVAAELEAGGDGLQVLRRYLRTPSSLCFAVITQHEHAVQIHRRLALRCR